MIRRHRIFLHPLHSPPSFLSLFPPSRRLAAVFDRAAAPVGTNSPGEEKIHPHNDAAWLAALRLRQKGRTALADAVPGSFAHPDYAKPPGKTGLSGRVKNHLRKCRSENISLFYQQLESIFLAGTKLDIDQG
jgi:hypothetical protein